MQQRRAIGQAQVEKDSVEGVSAQAIQGVGESIDGRHAGGSPVGPQTILFDFEQGIAQEVLVFEVVLHEQEIEGS